MHLEHTKGDSVINARCKQTLDRCSYLPFGVSVGQGDHQWTDSVPEADSESLIKNSVDDRLDLERTFLLRVIFFQSPYNVSNF